MLRANIGVRPEFGQYERTIRVNGRLIMGCGHTAREADINWRDMASYRYPHLATVFDYIIGDPLAWREHENTATN